MTIIQSILYGILQGFTEFLPVDPKAHFIALSHFMNWPEAEGPLMGVLLGGNLLAVAFYFRHDWASIISSFLQVILFRKKPMTLDERMPIFITLSTLPSIAGWYYLAPLLANIEWSPPRLAATVAAGGLLLALGERYCRQTKGMFDWNWLDTGLIGIFQLLVFIPGGGRMLGVFAAGMLCNYGREAITKYALLCAAPFLAGGAYLRLRELSIHMPAPGPDLSWLSFCVAGVVSFLTAMLVIGGMMRGAQRRSTKQWTLYRLVAAGALVVGYFFENR